MDAPTALTSRGIMLRVGAALLPAMLAAVWAFGWGMAMNLAVTTGAGLAFEAAWVWVRFHSLDAVKDGSTLVTCALIALCVPPSTHPGILLGRATVRALLGGRRRRPA